MSGDVWCVSECNVPAVSLPAALRLFGAVVLTLAGLTAEDHVSGPE
jgi:hypothetical protein